MPLTIDNIVVGSGPTLLQLNLEYWRSGEHTKVLTALRSMRPMDSARLAIAIYRELTDEERLDFTQAVLRGSGNNMGGRVK
jgi:hypothetical protein